MSRACDFPEFPYNQGHFERGVFVPDCRQCGLCCMFEYRRITNEEKYKEYALFDEMHGWKREGKVLRLYTPCKMLDLTEDGKYFCKIHESERPDCCKQHGLGHYHHPPGCSFFGGEFDAENYPHIPQEMKV